MAVLAYIGLGSNLGDRRAALETAVRRLRPLRVSSIAETAPWGRPDQPPFLNAVAEVATDAGPRELLDRLQEIEREAGRVRAERWGPRTLDLDLLLYGDRTVNVEGLVVPHPLLAGRRFVLEGIVELCPDLPVPGLGRTVRELLDAFPAAAGRAR
jgi:2-amino-4-hydroxy-6-hydroxymethyldihydropteridine diphosphokinase